jgi:hypothetical protein
MYLWICGSLMSAKNTWVHKSQIAKIYGPQIANLQIYTFEEGLQIYLKKIQVRTFADLRNLFVYNSLCTVESLLFTFTALSLISPF